MSYHKFSTADARPASRRSFLAAMGAGGLFFTSRGAFAQQLVLTPAQTLGPYYPDRLPLDQDNDLLVISDNITPAVGEITWLSGRVMNHRGEPIRAALVEIWQADHNGAYIHSASPIRNRDANFQGYGKFLTASNGEYLFRTVKPGLYPGRTRHAHMKVTLPGGQSLVTQVYVQGEALNNNDGVLNGIRDQSQRGAVIVPWTAIPESRLGELSARFDIVIGYTPADTAPVTRPTLVSMSGVVNGASLQPGIAAGGWVTLFGEGLAASTRTWSESDIRSGKLPQSLDGVSVSINNQPASVYYISPTQLNVQAPNTSSNGQVQVTVTNANGTSSAVTAEMKTHMPALFQIVSEYAAAVRADGVYLAPAGLISGLTTTPARPGDEILLFGTGFGPTVPNVAAGETVTAPAQLATPVTMRIDGAPADVRFAGLISPGLYQFNVVVPDVNDGDHAITAEINGVRTEKLARVRVQRQTTASRGRVRAVKGQTAMARFERLKKHIVEA